MRFVVRLFKLLLKFGMPLSLLLVPAFAVYGALVPWQEIQSDLSQHTGQTPVLVGASYRATYTASSTDVFVSRSYILVPSVLSNPRVLAFSKANEDPIVFSESRSALFLELAWLVVCAVGTWWFWFRPVPPNSSFKPNPLRGSA